MELEKVTIYDNDNTKIEMYKITADALNLKKLTTYFFDDIEREDVASEIASKITAFISKDDHVIMVDNVPVFSIGMRFLTIFEPYNIFEEAVLLIDEAFKTINGHITQEWKKDLSILIEKYYALQGIGDCKCIFFDTAVHKVDGFLYYLQKEESKVIILPFILNDGKIQRLY